MWCEQFNAEMLSNLDTIRIDESAAIRTARRTDVRPTTVAFVKAAVCTRLLRNEKYGRARVGGLSSDGRLFPYAYKASSRNESGLQTGKIALPSK